MARPLRIDIEDGLYHVTSRGWERRVTDAAVGVIGEYFGGVSMAAISKMVARVEHRRGEDRAWNRRLVGLLQRLRTSG
jgi:hypothetical protein